METYSWIRDLTASGLLGAIVIIALKLVMPKMIDTVSVQMTESQDRFQKILDQTHDTFKQTVDRLMQENEHCRTQWMEEFSRQRQQTSEMLQSITVQIEQFKEVIRACDKRHQQ